MLLEPEFHPRLDRRAQHRGGSPSRSVNAHWVPEVATFSEGAAFFSFLFTSFRVWHSLSSQEYSAAFSGGLITDLSPRRGLIEAPHLVAEAAPEGTTPHLVAQVRILGKVTLDSSLSLCPPLLNPTNNSYQLSQK